MPGIYGPNTRKTIEVKRVHQLLQDAILNPEASQHEQKTLCNILRDVLVQSNRYTGYAYVSEDHPIKINSDHPDYYRRRFH